MLNTMIIALAICGPAIATARPTAPTPARPTAPPPDAPSSAQQPLQVRVTIKVGNDARTHDLAISDNGCNKLEDRTDAYQDEISLCTRPAAQSVYVDIQWKTRTNNTEYKTSSGTVVARKGGKLEVGRVGGARFSLQLL